MYTSEYNLILAMNNLAASTGSTINHLGGMVKNAKKKMFRLRDPNTFRGLPKKRICSVVLLQSKGGGQPEKIGDGLSKIGSRLLINNDSSLKYICIDVLYIPHSL